MGSGCGCGREARHSSFGKLPSRAQWSEQTKSTRRVRYLLQPIGPPLELMVSAGEPVARR